MRLTRTRFYFNESLSLEYEDSKLEQSLPLQLIFFAEKLKAGKKPNSLTVCEVMFAAGHVGKDRNGVDV